MEKNISNRYLQLMIKLIEDGVGFKLELTVGQALVLFMMIHASMKYFNNMKCSKHNLAAMRRAIQIVDERMNALGIFHPIPVALDQVSILIEQVNRTHEGRIEIKLDPLSFTSLHGLFLFPIINAEDLEIDGVVLKKEFLQNHYLVNQVCCLFDDKLRKLEFTEKEIRYMNEAHFNAEFEMQEKPDES